MLTDLNGEVDDYADVVKAVERLCSALATTRAQRDAWDNRLHKLMDACGWDISFNLDRAIDAMVERLREANPDAPGLIGPPAPFELAAAPPSRVSASGSW